MTNYLPNLATVPEVCEWLATQTKEQWTLARLLERGLMPWVWLDYTPGWPDIFGDRTEGFLAPMMFFGDRTRLAAVGTDARITRTKLPSGDLLRITPGIHASIDELRFLRADITRLAGKLSAPVTSPSSDGRTNPADDVDHDKTLAALFDPVPVEALEKMFPSSGKWESWADKAKANGLIDARDGPAKFNPYKAGVWFHTRGAAGWDIARLYRVLENNLPARSRDSVHLLTRGID